MKVRPGRFIVIAAILSLLAFGFYSAGNVIFAEKPNFTSGSGYEENDEEEVSNAEEEIEEETQDEVLTDEEKEEENTASVSGYEAESDIVAAAVLGTVDRQDVTPGTQQTGHMNISGTGLFGKVKVSGDSGTSGLTGVDMEHTGTNPRKWRVGAQGSQLKGSFAITDITTSEVNPKYRLTINKFGKVGIGTKRPKEKLHVNGNVKANNFIGNGSGLTNLPSQIPTGVIVMWSGGTPPAGWALCNGLSGTPDLRSRFIVGAGGVDSYSVGSTGGETRHTLTVNEMPSHTHATNVNDPGHSHFIDLDDNFIGGGGIDDAGESSEGSDTTSTATTGIGVSVLPSGGGGSHENRPRYYALAFIMKL